MLILECYILGMHKCQKAITYLKQTRLHIIINLWILLFVDVEKKLTV